MTGLLVLSYRCHEMIRFQHQKIQMCGISFSTLESGYMRSEPKMVRSSCHKNLVFAIALCVGVWGLGHSWTPGNPHLLHTAEIQLH